MSVFCKQLKYSFDSFLIPEESEKLSYFLVLILSKVRILASDSQITPVPSQYGQGCFED